MHICKQFVYEKECISEGCGAGLLNLVKHKCFTEIRTDPLPKSPEQRLYLSCRLRHHNAQNSVRSGVWFFAVKNRLWTRANRVKCKRPRLTAFAASSGWRCRANKSLSVATYTRDMRYMSIRQHDEQTSVRESCC